MYEITFASGMSFITKELDSVNIGKKPFVVNGYYLHSEGSKHLETWINPKHVAAVQKLDVTELKNKVTQLKLAYAEAYSPVEKKYLNEKEYTAREYSPKNEYKKYEFGPERLPSEEKPAEWF